MTPDQIDRVLLVGGSSYVPLVQKSLAEIFGRDKLMMNIDPMKCVAYGAAILSAKWSEKIECPCGCENPGINMICDGCQQPLTAGTKCPRGHMNSPTNAKCEVCGEQLAQDVALCAQITAQHYGIRVQAETVKCPKGHENPGRDRRCGAEGCGELLFGGDDQFEIIIPKGTAYPTPEPVKKRFCTPAANLRRMRVRIYAGFDPIASKNELQATVWLELPGHVPEDTPVELAFSLDEDGILKKVLVTLMDGSGIMVGTYFDRGDSPRGRLEKKLDLLIKMGEQMDRQLDQLYGEVTQALNINNHTEAVRGLGVMEKLLSSPLAADRTREAVDR